MGLDIPNVRLIVHWQHPSSVEDYLQEFGRAGRDGNASIAVLLHDRNYARRDISLLQYMAARAVEGAKLEPVAANAALRQKTTQIEQMAKLTTGERCFRSSLTGYFTGPKRAARKSFSSWLLEFVFSDRAKVQQKVACCDACHERLIAHHGQLAFARKVLGV